MYPIVFFTPLAVTGTVQCNQNTIDIVSRQNKHVGKGNSDVCHPELKNSMTVCEISFARQTLETKPAMADLHWMGDGGQIVRILILYGTNYASCLQVIVFIACCCYIHSLFVLSRRLNECSLLDFVGLVMSVFPNTTMAGCLAIRVKSSE